MKMYHFNPNSYGYTYTVMAKTEEAAATFLYDHLNKKDIEAEQYAKNFYEECFGKYPDITFDYDPKTNSMKRPSYWRSEKDYMFNEDKSFKKGIKTTIDVFDIGDVLVLELG